MTLPPKRPTRGQTKHFFIIGRGNESPDFIRNQDRTQVLRPAGSPKRRAGYLFTVYKKIPPRAEALPEPSELGDIFFFALGLTI